MIGMMYLVLTAMLALNVSKDILNAFIIVNDGLEKTSINFKDKIDAQHTAFEKAYQENKVKVGPFYEKAKDVEERSDALYNYINQIKANIIAKTEGYPSWEDAIGKDQFGNDTLVNIKNIGKKDNYDVLTNELVGSEPGSPKTGELTASELKDKMAGFRDDFSLNNASSNWKYYWNKPDNWQAGSNPGDLYTGEIGKVSSYTPLISTGNMLSADGDENGGNSSPDTFVRLHSTGGHPGAPGTTESAGH